MERGALFTDVWRVIFSLLEVNYVGLTPQPAIVVRQSNYNQGES